MRPQQQNRRMRGRNNNNNNSNNNSNNNNRKGPNPLTRNYESNGPDVKIRGSAQQIAEKYSTLARDAMSAGDRVVAENYLQHAEHYNRIIAAAQAQMPIQQVRDQRDEFDDDIDDDRDEMDNQNGNGNGNGNAEAQPPVANGSGPQPVIDGTPAEVALSQDAASGDGPRDQRPNGSHNNGYNGEDGQRRNRRSRRGGRGRPDVEGDGDGEPTQSAESQDTVGSREPAEATVESTVREVPTPSEPEITVPTPLPVEPD
jgi:Domain of unknown function (DUF4167)